MAGIPDSTGKNFQDSGIRLPYMGTLQALPTLSAFVAETQPRRGHSEAITALLMNHS